MKYIYCFFVLSIIGVWSFHFFRTDLKDSIAAPKTTVSVENIIREVGKIPRNKQIEVSFKIKNIGDNPLVIYDVKADCYCTVPDWNHKPINPNHDDFVRLVYSAENSGFFQKKAVISSNNKTGNIILVIRGQVL